MGFEGATFPVRVRRAKIKENAAPLLFTRTRGI